MQSVVHCHDAFEFICRADTTYAAFLLFFFSAIFVTGNLGHPCLFPTFGIGGSKAGASSLALRRMSVITQSRKRETSVRLIG